MSAPTTPGAAPIERRPRPIYRPPLATTVPTLWAAADDPFNPLSWADVSNWLWGAAAVFATHENAADLRWLSAVARVRAGLVHRYAALHHVSDPRSATECELAGNPETLCSTWDKATRGRVRWSFVSEWLRKSARFRYPYQVAAELNWLARVAEWRERLELWGSHADTRSDNRRTRHGFR